MENFDEIDGEFRVIKALGKGYTAKVLLANHKKSNTNIAIKIYKPRKDITILEQEFENEVTTMKGVNHPNVLRIFAANNEGVYKYTKNTRKNDKSIIYLGVEVCNNGEFFDYIKEPGVGFSDKIARYYFHQIIEGLSSIHKAGLVHRDLKTENMFLDDNFNIKIGDFGFAKYLNINNNGQLTSYLGTPGYQSPQMLECKNYDGIENDIFSCGVILFVMCAGSPPFREARMSDPWYKNFLVGSIESFWKYHLRTKNFSESFIKLITGMLAFNNRFTINDIKKSDWYNEEVATKQEVLLEMENRKLLVDKALQRENNLIEINSDESLSSGSGGNKNYRCGYDGNIAALEVLEKNFTNMEIEEDFIVEWKRNKFDNGNYIRSNVSHSKIYCEVAYYLTCKYEGIILELNNGLLKMNAKYETSYDGEVSLDNLKINDIQSIDINIEVFKDDNEGSVVQFYKNESMSQFDFKNFYHELRRELEKIK